MSRSFVCVLLLVGVQAGCGRSDRAPSAHFESTLPFGHSGHAVTAHSAGVVASDGRRVTRPGLAGDTAPGVLLDSADGIPLVVHGLEAAPPQEWIDGNREFTVERLDTGEHFRVPYLVETVGRQDGKPIRVGAIAATRLPAGAGTCTASALAEALAMLGEARVSRALLAVLAKGQRLATPRKCSLKR